MSDWNTAPEVTPPAPPIAPSAGSWDAAPLAGPTPQQKAVANANENGDEAGKALSISKQTGIPAPVVQTDLSGYDAHARTKAAVKAMKNPAIAAYVDGNPMAAKVSADDYEKLDEVSQYLQNLQQDRISGQAHVGLVQGIPEIAEMLTTAPGRDKLFSALKQLPATLLHGMVDYVKTPGQVFSGEINLSTPQGLDTAIGFGVGAALSTGGKINVGRAPLPLLEGTVSFDTFMSTLRGMKTREEMDAFIKQKADADGSQLQIEHAKAATEGLDAAVEAAQESKTKTRSPEMFENFAAAHGDSDLYIDPQKIIDLYKDAAPREGDGLLGFIPDVLQKAEDAAATGGEVQVQLSKYLANIDPSVHDTLSDGIRLHDDGVTPAEAEELEKNKGFSLISDAVTQSIKDHFPEAFEEPVEDTAAVAGDKAISEAPQAETVEGSVKSTPGVNAGRLAKLLGPKLYGEPTNMATVSVKEMMQNAFDAVKGHLEKGLIQKGKINITTDKKTRSITVSDNGSGMTPQVLGKQFLEIAGTNKETKQASGGLGIAKMLFLFGNKRLDVMSIRDGMVSTMSTTGEALFGALEDPALAPNITVRKATPQELATSPHGTTVRVVVPEKFKDPSSGEMRNIEFPEYPWEHPVLEKSPLFHNIEVTHSPVEGVKGEVLPIGASFPHKNYTQFANMNFDWGTAHVYVSKESVQTYGNNVTVLSNGLYQFETKIQKNPNEAYGDAIARHFIIDIAPTATPEESGYPFDLNRQQFVAQTKKDFGNFFNYVSKLYQQMDLSTNVKNWGSIQYLDKNEAGGVTATNAKQLAPPVPTRPTAANAINEGDEVTVKEGKLVVNGREIPELSQKDLKDFDINTDELKFDQKEIDPTKPILHDNIDVLDDKIPANGIREVRSLVELGREKFGERFDSYVYGIGKAFIDLRDQVAQLMHYPELLEEGIGVSFDQEYRGVSIKVPFSGMFINPAVPKYTDPVRAAVGMVGTMIHELAHYKVRSHNAEFPAEMQDIQIQLDAMQHLMESLNDAETKTLWDFKNHVIDIVKEHDDVLTWLNKTVTKGTVTPRGKRFQDSGGYEAADAGAAGGVERPKSDAALHEGTDSTGGEQGPAGVPPEDESGTGGVVTAETLAVKKAQSDLYLNKLFKDAKSVGLTEPEFQKYSDKIQNANAKTIEKAIRRDAAKRTAPEWKNNEVAVKAEVEQRLAESGPYAARKYLDDNNIELDTEGVDNGMADSIAALFGYSSGAEMTAAIKDLPPLADAVKAETKREMEARFGTRAANITQAAREAVLSDEWPGILADEVRILAKAAKIEPMTHEDMVAWAKKSFGETNIVEAANWASLSRAVAKGGREAEKALLKGDVIEAFKAKQRQMLAAIKAKESAGLTKEIDSAEKKIDRFASNEVIPSLDQGHLEQIRQMLASVGVPQQFAPLADTPALRDFVADAEGQIAAAPWLMNGEQPKLTDMTVDQFRGFADTMKSLEHVGRLAKTLENAQKKADLDNVVFNIKKELERFNFIDQPLNPSLGQRTAALGRRIIGAHLLVERMFDYTDRFDPHGPITEFLDRPLRDSNSKEIKLTEQVTKRLRDLKQHTDASVNNLIDNKVIPDAMAKSGFAQMNRTNLRNLMAHMGNEIGVKKVTEGFNVPEDAIWKLINDNATAQDWKWVQGVWDVFAYLKPEADAMQLRDTGVPADAKVNRKITNAHGEFTGGYYPLVYDKFNSDIQGHMAAKNPIFAPTYIPATTPHGYTEAVTGYKGALDLTGGFLASRIQAMVHDIAFREAVRNANKLISNQDFMTSIAQHWGKEFAELLPGWLRDIANSHTLDDNYAQGIARGIAIVRQNTISTLIAFNPGTFLKHGGTAALMSAERVGGGAILSAAKDIGLKGAAAAAKDLLVRNDREADEAFMQAFHDALDQGERGENVRQFILDSSPVMRNRQRKVDDSIRGAVDAMNEAGFSTLLGNVRQNAMLLGRLAVAYSDSMSALPTWWASYKKAYLAGENHADAVFIADKDVSRTHGSNFVGDQPYVTRIPNTVGGEILKTGISLYKFWNHMVNNEFQLAWDTAATVRGPKPGEEQEPGANAASIAKRLAVMIGAIIIEEQATAPLDEDKHGLLTRMVLASMRFFGGGLVGLREVTNAAANGYEPSVGMIGTIIKAGVATAKDIAASTSPKAAISKDWLIHTATALGVLTGVGGTQVGKTGSFVKDLATGQERPQGFNAYRQGLRTGHSKARKF